MMDASLQATISFAEVLVSYSSSSRKFERFIQPVLVVLSPMKKRQESGGMDPSIALIQM